MCRHCNSQIPFYLNVPILSYLFLLGKTKCCKKPLAVQYPIVEFLTACLFAVIYWQFPFLEIINGVIKVDYPNFLRFAHAIIFCSALLVCSVIDIHHMIIPDVISIPMIFLSPLVVIIHPELDWVSSILGVLVGGFCLYAVAWIYWLVRREVGLGLGDVKLLAAIGGWLGYQAIIPTVFIGSITGALFGLTAIILIKKLTFKSAIPFGPFLAFGAVAHLVFGRYLREWLFLVSLDSPL